jgi:hypothetical protein
VRGVGFFPQLSFENQNTLCFKPTCIKTLASRTFEARNSSRIPLRFKVFPFIQVFLLNTHSYLKVARPISILQLDINRAHQRENVSKQCYFNDFHILSSYSKKLDVQSPMLFRLR